MALKIAVILSTYNQPGHLDLALHGYEVQDDPLAFEIIIADDGSGEDTRRVVEFHRDRFPGGLQHVWQDDAGFRKTKIINQAIAATTADYLIFSDGDCVPRRDFVRMHRLFARRDSYVTGAYNRLPQKTTDRATKEIVRSGALFSPFWLLRNGYLPTRGFVRIVVPNPIGRFLDHFGKVGFGRFTGGNAACFRDHALAVGGFNEAMSYGSEDREFGTRLCNFGLKPVRLKNSSFVMHLEHERPYADADEMARNKEILLATEESGEHGRKRAGRE